MLNQVPRNSGHVSRFPCEYAHVVPQELDERAFLFISKGGANARSLGRIVRDQLHDLKVRRLVHLPRGSLVRDLRVFYRKPLGLFLYFYCADAHIQHLREVETFLFTHVSDVYISPKRENTGSRRDLQ